MKIILAFINIKNSDQYKGDNKDSYENILTENIRYYVNLEPKRKVTVIAAYNFTEIKQQLFDDDRILIFSNFPPDNTFSKYETKEFKNGTGIIPDSYTNSINEFRTILSYNSGIELYITTGAPESVLKDDSVLSLSAMHKISILRKQDLAKKAGNTAEYYEKYILKTFLMSLGSNKK